MENIDRISALTRSFELSTTLPEDAKGWLQAKKTLRVGVTTPDYPPFSIIDPNGELQGITAEYLKSLQQALQVEMQIRRFSSRQQAFESLARGDIDLIETSTQAEVQKYGAALTHAYAFTRIALYSKTGSLLNIDLSDPGAKISLSDGGLISDEVLKHFRSATIAPFSSPLDAIASVLHSDSMAYLGDTVGTSYLINQSFNNQLVTNTAVENRDENIGFAVRQDDSQLQAILNQLLDSRSRCQKVAVINWWVSTLKCNENAFQQKLEPSEKALLGRNRTFKIAISEDLAPYAFFDGPGQFSGSISDILELIRLESGLKFEVVRTPNVQAAIVALNERRVDLSLFADNPARKPHYLFTQPIFSTPYNVIVRTDQPDGFSPKPTDTLTLALPKWDALEAYIASHYPALKLQSTESIADSLNRVRDGEADFTIVSTNQARYYLAYKYENGLKASNLFKGVNANVAIAANLDNPHLVSVIKKVLLEISPSEIAVITGRWRSNTATDSLYWEGLSLRVYQMLSALLAMLLITAVWIVFLRKRIFKRTIERKQLQLQLGLMQNMVNSIPHPVYVRDRAGDLVLFNTSYARTFEPAADSSAQPRQLDALVAPSILANWRRAYVEVEQSGIAQAGDQTLQQAGHKLEIYHWIEPLRDQDQRTIGVVCGWLDISERLRILDELRLAKESADQANHSKSIFLATMSHEIRTPMNAVIGMLELVLTRELVTGANHEAIQVAHEAAESLLGLLGSILDISSIESGQTRLHLERTTLRQLAEPITAIFAGTAKHKALTIDTQFDGHADLELLVDKLKIKQVLSNLLSNAIKFTEHGTIWLDISGRTTAPGTLELEFTVRDTGSGISEAEMSALFIPFSRVTVTNNSGAGLGLSICQSLSRIMGGDLQVSSTLGQGTSVTLCIPATRASPTLDAPPATPIAARTSPCALTVLVVEDHQPSLKLFKEQIEFLGHRPLLANNGLQALFLWEDAEFDLIITDCNMPELDGYELTREIRQLESQLRRRPCAIVGVTASAQKSDHILGIEAGMDQCLVKPVGLTELARLLPKVAGLTPGDGVGGLLANLPSNRRKDLVLDLLLSNAQDYHQLGKALLQSDWPSMKRIAHHLKSSAQIIASLELLDACEAIERALEKPIKIDELKLITQHLGRVLDEIKRELT
ncbi:transporter substrate-binding domain-containing protein [Pseudomonas lactis]|nr:transporter substrate-binding domain-containing protein [Pseudomonas lactis]